MAGSIPTAESVSITVENIGGIDAAEVTFTPGVTVLAGQNATNRTSMLRALAGVLGGGDGVLKTDTGSGRVKLNLDGQYVRTYEQRDGTVDTGGNPYLDDPDVVNLFVSILEDNELRRTVERGGDLREVIMRPIDTAAIQAEIRDLQERRNEIEEQIAEIDRRKDDLVDLEERKALLQSELVDIQDQLDTVQELIDDHEVEWDEVEEAENLIDRLDDLRQRHERIRDQIEAQQESLRALEAERDEKATKLDSLSTDDDLDAIEQEIATLTQRERTLADTIDDLTAIMSFNQRLLDVGGNLPGIDASDQVTAALDPESQELKCWTCGSVAERSDIESRLGGIRSLVAEKRKRRKEIQEELGDLRDQKRSVQSTVERVEQLESRLSEIDQEIRRREDKIERLESDARDTGDEISSVESEIEATEELRDSELLDNYQRLSKLQFEQGRLQQELESVQHEIEEIDNLVDEREELASERSQIMENLQDAQSRIEQLERDAVEQFNERMSDVLNLLGFENVTRVWFERTVAESRTGSNDTSFELHIVRETGNGCVYDDTVETLSESEREVIGLVVVLTGYLVHEVYEQVPMMLLDSLEAIDAERIAALVDYFAEYVPYLIIALLPEDAQALGDECEQVSPASFAP